MRVAFLLPDLRAGGAQHMIINMANEFANRGNKVDIVLASDAGTFRSKIKPNVRTVVLGKKRVVTAIPALRQYLNKTQPDIVLSALTHMNIAVMIARLGLALSTKFILTERNFFSASNKKLGIFKRILAPILLRHFYNDADMVIGISKGVIDDVARVAGIPATKAAWVHNPVVTPEMQAISFPTKVVNDIPVIITSGRLVEQKDHVTLLKAFSILLKKRPAKLVILGAGPMEKELKSLAASLSILRNVDFKGYVESPWTDMGQADVFVISSRWEGFCNVIVEAMLAGLCVVSTDCPYGPAEILENGKYGFLTPVGDIDSLAAALEQAIDAPKRPEAQRARALDFTTDKICSIYEVHMLGLLKETS